MNTVVLKVSEEDLFNTLLYCHANIPRSSPPERYDNGDGVCRYMLKTNGGDDPHNVTFYFALRDSSVNVMVGYEMQVASHMDKNDPYYKPKSTMEIDTFVYGSPEFLLAQMKNEIWRLLPKKYLNVWQKVRPNDLVVFESHFHQIFEFGEHDIQNPFNMHRCKPLKPTIKAFIEEHAIELRYWTHCVIFEMKNMRDIEPLTDLLGSVSGAVSSYKAPALAAPQNVDDDSKTPVQHLSVNDADYNSLRRAMDILDIEVVEEALSSQVPMVAAVQTLLENPDDTDCDSYSP